MPGIKLAIRSLHARFAAAAVTRQAAAAKLVALRIPISVPNPVLALLALQARRLEVILTRHVLQAVAPTAQGFTSDLTDALPGWSAPWTVFPHPPPPPPHTDARPPVRPSVLGFGGKKESSLAQSGLVMRTL